MGLGSVENSANTHLIFPICDRKCAGISNLDDATSGIEETVDSTIAGSGAGNFVLKEHGTHSFALLSDSPSPFSAFFYLVIHQARSHVESGIWNSGLGRRDQRGTRRFPWDGDVVLFLGGRLIEADAWGTEKKYQCASNFRTRTFSQIGCPRLFQLGQSSRNCFPSRQDRSHSRR